MSAKGDRPTSPDEEVIFAAAITTRNGKRLIAAHYGLKGFPIRINRKKPPKNPPDK